MAPYNSMASISKKSAVGNPRFFRLTVSWGYGKLRIELEGFVCLL